MHIFLAEGWGHSSPVFPSSGCLGDVDDETEASTADMPQQTRTADGGLGDSGELACPSQNRRWRTFLMLAVKTPSGPRCLASQAKLRGLH